jgi:hypothetical protein
MLLFLKAIVWPGTVAHIWNPSYLGGWDQEDWGSRPAWANILQDPISKLTRVKWTGSVAQAVEHLVCKCEALSSNSGYTHTHTHTHTQSYWLSISKCVLVKWKIILSHNITLSVFCLIVTHNFMTSSLAFCECNHLYCVFLFFCDISPPNLHHKELAVALKDLQ